MKHLEIINESLVVAAEELGDFTPLVFEQFYARYPDAKEYFSRSDNLEGNMLSEVVFCFIEQLEAPIRARITLTEVVSQHLVLGIPIEHFIGLFESVADIIQELAPEKQRTNWSDSWGNTLNTLRTIIIEQSESPHSETNPIQQYPPR